MRLVSWNIWGGSRRGIGRAVASLEADIAILLDCRTNNLHRVLSEARASGYRHHLARVARGQAVVAVSREPIREGAIAGAAAAERWLHVVYEPTGLEIGAIYSPLPGKMDGHLTMQQFWDWVEGASVPMLERPALLCGDFNTGDPTLDSGNNYRFTASHRPSVAARSGLARRVSSAARRGPFLQLVEGQCWLPDRSLPAEPADAARYWRPVCRVVGRSPVWHFAYSA